MKILELNIRNLRKIEAIDINPASNMIKIEGKNNQGKTTILDSILFALGGGKVPGGVIKDGESKSIITVKFGDYIVKKTITDVSTYLTVETISGMKPKNPQSFLNDLVGKIAFDPLEFMRMDSKKQVDILKKVMGIEEKINQLKIDEKNTMEERTFSGREMSRYEALCREVIKPITEPESISSITSELDKLQKQREDYHIQLDDIAKTKNQKVQIENAINELERSLAKLHIEQKEISAKLNDFEEENIKDFVDKIDHDIANKKTVLNHHELVLTEFNKYKIYSENRKIFSEKEKQYNDLDSKVESIRREIKETLSNAKLPIPGLDLTDNELLYNGHGFENVCESSKLKISVALTMAMNPKLKVILIRDGSLLDNDSLKEIQTIADKEDYQIWIEKVASEKGEEDAIYIVEGEVK